MKTYLKYLCLVPAVLLAFTFKPTLQISSPAFSAGGMIPAKYTCEGAEVSPPLRVSHIPAGTRSLALTLHDPDAPHPGGVTHWVIWNLPVNGQIPEHFTDGITGLNSDQKNTYKGMCPPSGTHRYNFKVYALDSMLQLPANTDQAGLEKAVQGHILAEGLLTGKYSKSKK